MLETLSALLQVVKELPEVAQMAVGFAIAMLVLAIGAAIVIYAASRYRKAQHPPAPKKVVQVMSGSAESNDGESADESEDATTSKPRRAALIALISLLLGAR